MTEQEMLELAKDQLVFDFTQKKYITIEEARNNRDVSPIIERFGSWAVTTYGVECLIYVYRIKSTDLNTFGLDKDILDKTWPVPKSLSH